MMIKGASIAFLLSVASPAAAGSAREAYLAQAQVQRIDRQTPSDVIVIRSDSHSEPLQPYDYLFSGDRIILRGDNATVDLAIKGRSSREILSSRTTREYLVAADRRRIWSQAASDVLSSVGYLFASPASSVTSTLAARGDGKGPKRSAFHTSLVISQWLPPNTRAVAPAWVGDVALVRVFDERGAPVAQADAIGKGAARLVLDAGVRSGTVELVKLAGRPHRFAFSVSTGAVPRPAGVTARDPAGDLAWALWLATRGPREWRLLGYSSLAELAETDFAAARIWDAIRNGREIAP